MVDSNFYQLTHMKMADSTISLSSGNNPLFCWLLYYKSILIRICQQTLVASPLYLFNRLAPYKYYYLATSARVIYSAIFMQI